jgi:hypothetical protein
MTRFRLILLSMFAVFAVSGVTSAVALAAEPPEWWVNGAALTAKPEEEIFPVLKVPAKQEQVQICNTTEDGAECTKADFVILFHNSEIEVKCPEVSFINSAGVETAESGTQDAIDTSARIIGPRGGSVHQIQFSECTLVKPTNCAIVDDITTDPITLKLEPTETAPTVKFEPTAGATGKFAEFELTGTCVLRGVYIVKGSTTASLTKMPNTERQLHGLLFNEAPSTLKIAGQAVNSFKGERTLEVGWENASGDRNWDAK